MITVDHYGLHWVDGNVGLLIQGHNRADHLLGVDIQYPVEVTNRMACPHNIDLGSRAEADLNDPLVERMMPVPKPNGERATFLEDSIENKNLVQELLRLSTGKGMFPLWSLEPSRAQVLLGLTNVQPLVIYGCGPNMRQPLSRIIEGAYFSPRRLILLGSSWTVLRPEAERVQTALTASAVRDMPLEKIGAQRLWKKMMTGD